MFDFVAIEEFRRFWKTSLHLRTSLVNKIQERQCVKCFRIQSFFILHFPNSVRKKKKPEKLRFCILFMLWICLSLVMMMMMICFCGMVDRRKAFSLISSRDHCQRSSPLQISDTPQAGFEPAQNLSSGFVEWSCAVVVTTTPHLILIGHILFTMSCGTSVN